MADSATDKVKDNASDATDAIKDQVKDAVGGDDDGLIGPLKKAAVTAAVTALTPVIKEAVTNGSEGMAKKLPEMLENAGGMEGIADLAKDKLGESGGMGKVASFAMDKLGGGGDGGGMLSGALGALTGGGDDSNGDSSPPDGTGNNRRMPVQQAVDVAAPLSVVYNQFTQFEEWTNFVFRVPSVHQEDEANLKFKTKQWNFGREWEAEIIDQRPDERILWQSTSGLSLTGVTTFHELAPRLTRVEVNIDFDPAGFFEKIGRGWRFAKRTIRADLHRFKAYVEMNEVEDGEWRGYIKDGQVVSEEDYYGKEMAAGAEGKLLDEEGNPLALDEDGNLVDEEGEPVALDEEGNPLAFDEAGHPIAFDEEGNLIAVDEEGNPVAAEEEKPSDETGAVDEDELEEEDAVAEEEGEEVASSPSKSRSRSKTGSAESKNGGSESQKTSSKAKNGGRSRSSGSRAKSSGNGAAGSSNGRSRSRGASKASSSGSGRSRSKASSGSGSRS
jgi:uncharacterized membrane protein